MVNTCTVPARSGKCHFLRQILLLCTPPGRAKRGWAGCILIFWLIQIYMHILGPENATFWGNSCYYSLTRLPRLLHVLNILGQYNATFWGDSCNYSFTHLQVLLHVLNILAQQLTPIQMVTKGTEPISSRPCHFLRLTICTVHIRFRKCHFLRWLLLL